MEIDRKELKHQAKERIALTDPKFWVVALTYIAMTTGVSWLVSLIPLPTAGASSLPFLDMLQSFLQLLLRFYTTVVQFGLCLWALWTYRQLDPGLNSLMQGFSVAGRVLLMELGISVRILGWYFFISLALILPFTALLMSPANYAVGLTCAFLIFFILVIVFITLLLRYALAPYLLADRPDDGPSAPIYRSVSLMRGWKFELFKLEFSFIGYDLINFILAGLVLFFFVGQAGLLNGADLTDLAWWDQLFYVLYSPPAVILSTLVTIPVNLLLLPYRAVARAGFYDARMLAAQQEIRLPNMPPL